MKHFTEKPEKYFIISVEQIESLILENPIIFPIVVIDSVLPNISRSVVETAVH